MMPGLNLSLAARAAARSWGRSASGQRIRRNASAREMGTAEAGLLSGRESAMSARAMAERLDALLNSRSLHYASPSLREREASVGMTVLLFVSLLPFGEMIQERGGCGSSASEVCNSVELRSTGQPRAAVPT